MWITSKVSGSKGRGSITLCLTKRTLDGNGLKVAASVQPGGRRMMGGTYLGGKSETSTATTSASG